MKYIGIILAFMTFISVSAIETCDLFKNYNNEVYSKQLNQGSAFSIWEQKMSVKFAKHFDLKNSRGKAIRNFKALKKYFVNKQPIDMFRLSIIQYRSLRLVQIIATEEENTFSLITSLDGSPLAYSKNNDQFLNKGISCL